MKILPWSKSKQRRSASHPHRLIRSRRNLLEMLEDRRLLAVITVDNLQSGTAIDGQVTLEEAIQAANTDSSVDGSTSGSGADTIEFAPTLNGTITLPAEFAVTAALTIDGADRITLDGNQGARLFNVTDGDLTLQGLTLTRGNAAGGGAIRFDSAGTLRLEDVTISASNSSGDGGAVLMQRGQLQVINSVLDGNTAGLNGGAIAALGAVSASITASTITANQSVGMGGGIYTLGNVDLLNTTVSGNSTTGNTSYGGGIFSKDASLTVTQSTIANNSTSGTLADGGGVFSDTNLTDQTTTILQSTISGNTSAARGGGLFNLDGQTIIRHSTITNNATTSTLGGGVVSYADNNTRTTVTSSIIAGNSVSDVDFNGGVTNSFVSGGFNVIGTGNAVVSFTQAGDQPDVANPGLGPLEDNGGLTLTHNPVGGSPVLDAGDPLFDPSTLPNDQRGFPFPRLSDGRIDIGSVERIRTNAAPAISPIDDVSASVNSVVGPIAFTVGDVESAADTLAVVAVSSNTTLVPISNIDITGTGAQRQITVTLAADQVGSATLTVTVTDPDGMFSTELFDIEVANEVPTISNIDNITVDAGTVIPPIPFTVSDAETAVTLLDVTAVSDNQTLVPDVNLAIGGFGANRDITITPAAGQAGTATITVTVTDGNGASASDTFVLTVLGNSAPTISDIGNQSVPLNTPTPVISFTIGDGESAANLLTVTATSSDPTLIPNSGITLGGAGTDRNIQVTPASGQTGVATITVTVTDPGNLSSTDTFTVMVSSGNAPPTISNISDQSIIENNSTAPIPFTVGDAETSATALGVTATSSNQTLVPAGNILLEGIGTNRTITVTPATDQVGNVTITITVTDAAGNSVTEAFVITVNRDTQATLSGEVFIDSNGNSVQDPLEIGAAGIRVYADANNNLQLDAGEVFTTTDTAGSYNLVGLDAGDYVIRVDPPQGQTQSSPNAYFGIGTDNASGQDQLFQMSLAGEVQPIGMPTPEVLDGLVRSNDGSIFSLADVDGNGSADTVFAIDPVTGQATALPISSSLDLVGGLAYDPATNTMYTLSKDPALPDTVRLHSVSQTNGSVGPALGLGLSGIADASALTFDTVGGRIIGFDNADNQFFAFQIDGTGTSLSVASRAIDADSLAFNRSTFVMIDLTNPADARAIAVDPDSGAVVDAFTPSQNLAVNGLFHAKQGNTPYFLTLNEGDDIVDIDFGLAVPLTPQVEDFPTVLNELLVDLSFRGNDLEDQYLEFRGRPGGQINANTYFVVVDDRTNPGSVEAIIDLSNQPLGANGFLVLLQQNNVHQPNPASAVLTSTEAGFGMLPGDIFTGSGGSDRIFADANSYFLIETEVAPQIDDDIDADDDGLADPDGIKSNWTVLDSVSLHTAFFSGQQAYGQILLAESDPLNDPNTRTVEPGTPIVVTNGFGYAGRLGDSVGSDADDWVFGSATDANRNLSLRPTLFELESDFFDYSEPRAFQRRDLDHIGESNFVGGVRGQITLAPGLGETDPAGNPLPTVPAAGLTVLADTNSNGQLDTLSYFADPDFVVDPFNRFDAFGNEIRFPLANAFPGVTITTVDDFNEPISLEVTTSLETNFFTPTPIPNYLFSYQGIDQFSSFRRLRFDFYEPVSEVSIQALGAEFGLIPSIGTLEAYDANDQLIDSAASGLLVRQSRQTITVSSDTEEIAYVVAFGDDRIPNSTSARFDQLSFKQSEPHAVTDDNGTYEIKNIFPASYEVSVLANEASDGLIGGTPLQIQIDRYENFVFNDSLRPNVAPEVEEEINFNVDENLPSGTTIGFVNAVDLDRQPLQYEILDGLEHGLLVDPDSGEITVGPDAELDFEDTPQIVLEVGVSDPFVTVITEVVITLNDLNEAPVVQESVFFVAEGTANGITIGQIDAFDPDTSQNQTVTFQVVAGTGVGVFSVNPANGLVTLVDEAAINFETLNELNLIVDISDSSIPPLVTRIDQRIRVIDQNDPPVLVTTGLTVPETAMGVVGQLVVDDPDALQTHVFELRGGTGADTFRVARDGTVSVREGVILNFEGTSSYTLDVIIIDSGEPPLAVDGTVNISIQDVNEPPGLNVRSATIPENSPGGTFVTSLVAIDPENSGSAYTIALLDQADAASFQFDPANNELTVAAGADLDFEEQPVLELIFAITDPNGIDPVSEVSFVVELTDQNDPPIVVTEEVVLSELARPGTIVGRVEVQVREPDSGDQVTVAIVGGNAADRFDLDPVSRILRVAQGATFDADGNPDPLFIDVEVTDAGGLSSVGTIDVILNDVNEPPVIVSPPGPQSIVSGENFQLFISEESIVDPEGRAYSLAIFDETGSLPDWLDFDEASRTLSGLPTPLDVGSYQLMLRAFEPGPLELFSQVSFTVDVAIGDTPLTNQRNRLDVDANGDIAPLDALRVINYIDRHGSGVSAKEPHRFTGFVDTSQDGIVTALDALRVINGLEEQPFRGLGEWIADDDREEATDRALVDLIDQLSLF